MFVLRDRAQTTIPQRDHELLQRAMRYHRSVLGVTFFR
jgi:hypothetical protein